MPIELLSREAALEVVRRFLQQMDFKSDENRPTELVALTDQDGDGLRLRVCVGSSRARRRIVLEQSSADGAGLGGRRVPTHLAVWRLGLAPHRGDDYKIYNQLKEPAEGLTFTHACASMALQLALAEFVAMIVRFNCTAKECYWGDPLGTRGPHEEQAPAAHG